MDPQGAVIPQAEIKFEEKTGKETITGLTGPTGELREPKIAAGRYQVTVKSPGFRTFTGVIDIHDGILLGLKVKLPVAAVNTTVEVRAETMGIVDTVGVLAEVHNSIPAGPSSGGLSPMRQ